MEISRTPNTNNFITFPLIDASSRPDYYTGVLTGTSVTSYKWDNGGSPTLQVIAGAPAQLGTTGEWQLQVFTKDHILSLKSLQEGH